MNKTSIILIVSLIFICLPGFLTHNAEIVNATELVSINATRTDFTNGVSVRPSMSCRRNS